VTRKFEKLEDERPRGKTDRKSKSEARQEIGKRNARREETTKRFEDQHPAAGPGLSGALGSLRKGGEEEQGYSEGLLEALHAGMGTEIGKTKCGDVTGRLR
jgi:hypothetical protein